MKEFKQGTPIGEYSVLYAITNKEYTQTYCVADKNNFQFFMKVYFMEDMPQTLMHDEVPSELWAYKQLGLCDNLLRMQKYGYESAGGKKFTYFVTNYFRGKLLSQLVEEKGCLSAEETLDIALGLVKAVRHLNERHICHLDITPQNVLLEAREEGGYTPKLFDLEHACEFDTNTQTYCSPRRLEKINPYFSRTELLAKHEITDADDTFSIGALIYYMLTGKTPWRECKLEADMPAAAKHIKMNKWRLEHTASSFIETLHPTKNDVTQTLANLYVAMVQTMEDGTINTDTLERILTTENTELEKIAVEVARADTRSVEDLKGFASIAGMDALKQNLSQHVLWPLRHPDKAKEYRIELPNGLLLYGPPGCGKTYFASKLAEELHWRMKYYSTSSLGSTYQHETQANIRSMFEEAKAYGRFVICIDEIDGILSTRSERRSGEHNDEVNEFLSQFNNCRDKGVLVVGTTNRKDIIDPAALRAGRFDIQIEIKAPDLELRKRLFEMYLRNRPLAADIDISALAAMTENYASVDIPFVINEAALIAAMADKPISQQHLTDVIRNHKSSLQASASRIGFE